MQLLNLDVNRRPTVAHRTGATGRGKFLAGTMALFGFLAGAAQADGTLVIAGGGIGSDTDDVYAAFIDALPRTGRIVVVPAASASPVQSARWFMDELRARGVDPERLLAFPLAVLDDESTPDVDESGWRDHAWDAARVAELGQPAGFWFTGGDQIRIMETMTRDADTASPLLDLMRTRLAGGAVVGGSSAGAAIMSRHMIAGGESFTALVEPVHANYRSADGDPGGPLLLTRGAGFLPLGVVDQHFGQRARLGRLVRALAATGESFGYGIDEDTAMVVDLESGQARVLGRGGVTLLDASRAEFDFESGALARQLAIGFAAAGAQFYLGQCQLSGDIGAATRGRESYNEAVENGGGMAFAHQRLDELLGADLLDNSGVARFERFSMRDDGSLLIYAFSKTPDSVGFRSADDGPTRYSACNVRFEVTRANWNQAPVMR